MAQDLTSEGRALVEDVARRHEVTPATVSALLAALMAGGGAQAQFDIAELGGMGQWSQGGMTMVGDMFNTALRARVDALCAELSQAARSQRGGRSDDADASLVGPGAGASGAWWPDGLGSASSSGAQNDMRYAVFPAARRLAIETRGRVRVHDTGDHRIGGVSQQQGGDVSLSFTSQHGPVRVADLPLVEGARAQSDEDGGGAPDAGADVGANDGADGPAARSAATSGDGEDIFGKLERLADLRRKDVITDAEFVAKKAELLARL